MSCRKGLLDAWMLGHELDDVVIKTIEHLRPHLSLEATLRGLPTLLTTKGKYIRLEDALAAVRRRNAP